MSASLSAARAQVPANSTLSIVEIGKNPDGRALFNVEAKNADLAKLLRIMFEKAGQEVVVDPDVQGIVPEFTRKNKTLIELLQALREGSQGALMVRPGKITRISRTNSTAIAINARPGLPPSVVPDQSAVGLMGTNHALGRLGRPIVLNIPDNSPILLSQAFAQIQQQTGVPIKLHPSVPADVKFSAVFLQVPAYRAIDWIARSGSLRVTQHADGSLLVAMADRSANKLAPCPRCKSNIPNSLRICPHCGAPNPAKTTPPAPKPSPEEEQEQ